MNIANLATNPENEEKIYNFIRAKRKEYRRECQTAHVSLEYHLQNEVIDMQLVMETSIQAAKLEVLFKIWNCLFSRSQDCASADVGQFGLVRELKCCLADWIGSHADKPDYIAIAAQIIKEHF